MATKDNPGKYDCYSKAAPDEPLFTLRGKDPSAPYFVQMWTASRMGNKEAVHNMVEMMFHDNDVLARVSTDEHDKLKEAKAVAGEMLVWRKRKEAADAKGAGR